MDNQIRGTIIRTLEKRKSVLLEKGLMSIPNMEERIKELQAEIDNKQKYSYSQAGGLGIQMEISHETNRKLIAELSGRLKRAKKELQEIVEALAHMKTVKVTEEAEVLKEQAPVYDTEGESEYEICLREAQKVVIGGQFYPAFDAIEKERVSEVLWKIVLELDLANEGEIKITKRRREIVKEFLADWVHTIEPMNQEEADMKQAILKEL